MLSQDAPVGVKCTTNRERLFSQARTSGGCACRSCRPSDGAGASSLHPQARLRTVERLDLALFVAAEHQRVIGRLQVQPHHIQQLVLEARIARELEGARPLAEGKQPLIAHLARLRTIRPKGAWVLVNEVFGWRHFANRRELASSPGLVPTPYARGDSEIEQGGREQASAKLAGGAGLELGTPTARQRTGAVVQPALRWRGQAHAPCGDRGSGAATGHRTVALPGGRRDPGGRALEAYRSSRLSKHSHTEQRTQRQHHDHRSTRP